MRQNKHMLLLFALFFLLSLACAGVVVPAEQPADNSSDQPGAESVPGNEEAEPLPTLAPLPGTNDEEAAGSIEVENPNLAESEITVNDIGWTVLDAVELGVTLESGSDEIADLDADGRLVGIRFTITNQGEDLYTFIGLELVDSTGQRHSYLSDSLDFITEEEACQMVALEPDGVVTCTAIYDIPVEAVGLQAVFTDLSLFGGEESLVDLGLE